MYPFFFSHLVGDKRFYGVSVISPFLRKSRKNETALGTISFCKYVLLFVLLLLVGVGGGGL